MRFGASLILPGFNVIPRVMQAQRRLFAKESAFAGFLLFCKPLKCENEAGVYPLSSTVSPSERYAASFAQASPVKKLLTAW
ncbi:hypothetical protein [Agrobacterium larrymoorei]|uniref:hypothetical protein n=1 Tax=Agrobacterium larrymoorei TaxID=160699 RepID=UPI0030BF6F11